MTTFKIALLATAAVVASGSIALATDVPGPYIGIGAGWHVPRDSNVNLQVGATATNPTIEFNNGWGALGSLGYQTEGGFRPELEISYRRAKVDNFNGVTWTGRQTDWAVMGNLAFDFAPGSNFSPYLGAGIGLSWLQLSQVTAPGQPIFDGRDRRFAWQGIAGINIAVSRRTDLFIDYRYIGLNNANYSAATPAGSGIGDHDARSHNIFVGLRFALGDEPAPPPQPVAAPPRPAPPPAAAPAPPPPPAAPQKFIAFFDFDRSDLRADAQKIVAEAAAYARSGGKAVIQVTGHADTSGTAAYNLGLSERRARAVQAELVRQGIAASGITVSWRGEAEPLVATGDGVREPQNRRVEIVFE